MSGNLCLKMLLLGDSGVGKSSLARRFVDNEFSYDFTTTLGVDFMKKTVMTTEGRRVNLIILDMAGQTRFRSIIAQYFRGCSGALVAFDRQDDQSFHAVKAWVKLAREYAVDLPVILVETKGDKSGSDEAYLVEDKDVEQLAEELSCTWLRTSAKSGQNVSDAFELLVDQMVKNFEQEGEATKHLRAVEQELLLDLSIAPAGKRKTCCRIM